MNMFFNICWIIVVTQWAIMSYFGITFGHTNWGLAIAQLLLVVMLLMDLIKRSMKMKKNKK